MSSVTLILIILINNIYQTRTTTQCNLLNAIDLQSATYRHSLILRVQSVYLSEDIDKTILVSQVLVREVIKISKTSIHQIKINDIILIRIDNDIEEMLDDSCWNLLRVATIDMILFLNETNTNQFDLRYPPIESTLYVRQNIDAVINYETYSPQVIIKTPMNKPALSNDYSVQCNVRGNPLPRLLWSKNNQISEYYPSDKQCKTPCRIYSVQNNYESILYFQTITAADSGFYMCHAENEINSAMTNVYINVDQPNEINTPSTNLTCAALNYCNDRGQCIPVDKQLKCLCNDGYFGEECQTNYDDIIKTQNNAILLFKSRLLSACILMFVSFILIMIAFISCSRAKNNKANRRNLLTAKSSITNGRIPKSPLTAHVNNKSEVQQSSSMPSVRVINNHPMLTKESLGMVEHDNNDDMYTNSNGYCNSTKRDNRCFPMRINHTGDYNFVKKPDHLILSEGYLEFYQPDVESGLIRPLTLRTETPKSSRNSNRFHLPKPVNPN